MEIAEERKGDISILQVAGKLDASTSKELEDRVLALVASGRNKLVVDLSRLDYISSAGLRVFLLAAKRMEATSGRLVLSSLNPAVKQVFDIAGFSSYLTLAASTDEALGKL